jgi:hypothetical protein
VLGVLSLLMLRNFDALILEQKIQEAHLQKIQSFYAGERKESDAQPANFF